MIRLASFIKIMAVAALPIFISCISKTPVEQKSFSENITIPDILKNSKDIEALVTKTESQINHLAVQSQQLIEEYRSLSDNSNKKNGLMTDVKKVTLKGRINGVFADLSEIYSKIDLQFSEFENLLNTEQKLACKSVSNQLKNRIDDVMIRFNPVEEESKKGKIIIF